MISYELKPPVENGTIDELEVFLDDSGVDRLILQLQSLKNNRTDHVHLMSESWGGSELAEQPRNSANIPLRHVKIYKIP